MVNLPNFAKNDLLRVIRPISYEHFREILSFPLWNYFLRFIQITREYSKGLTIGIHLLNMNEEYKEKLSQKEYEDNIRLLYDLCLEMLNKLDRWDDFLSAFEQVWKDKRFVFRCHKNSLKEPFGDILAKGIISETKYYLYVHEFYLHIISKEIIERKVKRRNQGRKLGNMYHHTKEDLTTEEKFIRKRWLEDLIIDLKEYKNSH